MKKAIFGLGVSARAVLEYLLEYEKQPFYIINKGDPSSWDVPNEIDRSSLICEEKAPLILSALDQIVLSPGIPLDHPLLIEARKYDVEIISEVEFAFRRSEVPVIAITGSNGKTTCAMMTSQLLTDHGMKVFLGGNIGVPYTEILKDQFDVAVIELSSFQLESIKSFRANAALITNITTGHTERYHSHNDYIDAKKQIALNRPDYMIVGEAKLLSIIDHSRLPGGCDELDMKTSKLVGDHNKENFLMSIELVKSFLQTRFDRSLISKFVSSFSGANYRCELIFDDHIKVYNDGKSTSQEATYEALKACKGNQRLLIVGGKLRCNDVDMSSFEFDNCTTYYFGEATKLIEDKSRAFNNLESLVSSIDFKQFDTIIFSPAFPSFDLYQNYIDRAQDFNRLIRSYLKEK